VFGIPPLVQRTAGLACNRGLHHLVPPKLVRPRNPPPKHSACLNRLRYESEYTLKGIRFQMSVAEYSGGAQRVKSF
jgi:hypothetical protein